MKIFRRWRAPARIIFRAKWISVFIFALALLPALVPCLGAGQGGSDRPPGSALDPTKLDEFLSQVAREWNQGCFLLLIRNQKVLYEKSFGGFDQKKPIKIASSTKWLTGAVILALVDEGRLGLDDPVSRFLPEFSGDKARITVRQLLSHMSGLPMSARELQNREISLKQAVEAIAAARLMSVPGEMCIYGDASIQVAGRIAEIASRIEAPSGRAWKTLFSSRLTGPLEMIGTSFEGPDSTDNPHLAGGAISTVSDYANFLVMLLNGGTFRGRRILSEASVKEMFRDQTAGKPLRFNPFQSFVDLFPGWPDVRYGICNWLERIDRASGKILEAGAPGIFGFCPWIDFERNTVGVFAAESGMEKAFPAYLKLKTLIRD